VPRGDQVRASLSAQSDAVVTFGARGTHGAGDSGHGPREILPSALPNGRYKV
jgi:hypothetical protein